MKTVLILDDDKQIRDVLFEALKIRGYNPLAANTIEDGLASLKDSAIDLILLDHYLHEGQGKDFIEKMDKKDIPIIVVSNSAHIEEIYLKLGVKKCMVKSDTSLEQLAEEMKKYI